MAQRLDDHGVGALTDALRMESEGPNFPSLALLALSVSRNRQALRGPSGDPTQPGAPIDASAGYELGLAKSAQDKQRWLGLLPANNSFSRPPLAWRFHSGLLHARRSQDPTRSHPTAPHFGDATGARSGAKRPPRLSALYSPSCGTARARRSPATWPCRACALWCPVRST